MKFGTFTLIKEIIISYEPFLNYTYPTTISGRLSFSVEFHPMFSIHFLEKCFGRRGRGVNFLENKILKPQGLLQENQLLPIKIYIKFSCVTPSVWQE